jgi:hypothetical protein
MTTTFPEYPFDAVRIPNSAQAKPKPKEGDVDFCGQPSKPGAERSFSERSEGKAQRSRGRAGGAQRRAVGQHKSRARHTPISARLIFEP